MTQIPTIRLEKEFREDEGKTLHSRLELEIGILEGMGLYSELDFSVNSVIVPGDMRHLGRITVDFSTSKLVPPGYVPVVETRDYTPQDANRTNE